MEAIIIKLRVKKKAESRKVKQPLNYKLFKF